MFSRLRGFLYRHRRKFLISGIVFGSAVFLMRFTQRKIREWQEKEIRELLEKSKRQQHFEATERTCNQTIINLASTLRKSITEIIDTESIVEQLKNGCENKVEAWNKLKVLAFSRTTVVVYSYAMLVATLRIQVNLIGSYFYKDSNQNEKKLTDDIVQKYLSLSSYFMTEGIKNLCEFINEKVTVVTETISLKDELNLRDIEQVYWLIVCAVMMNPEKDPIKKLSMYMISPDCMEEENEIIRKMTKETLDLLKSDEVQHLIQNTIASGFHVIIDHISDYFEQSSGKTFKNSVTSLSPVAGPSTSKDVAWENKIGNCNAAELMSFSTVRKPMAKIIPILNGQVPTKPKTGDMPADLLQRLIFNDKYKTLGANVYEAFSCLNKQ